ncbi:uncharacterized protein [Miscanthus floridulus]|uniref:uncharacterized protein n=1 Tax=Miscanthus floridulus TaxID=154761 RepID=UPI003459057F
MLFARCRRSLLAAGDGRKERGQRGTVNAEASAAASEGVAPAREQRQPRREQREEASGSGREDGEGGIESMTHSVGARLWGFERPAACGVRPLDRRRCPRLVWAKAEAGGRTRAASAFAGAGQPATVRIDIPPTSPGRAAFKVWDCGRSSSTCSARTERADPAAAFVHRKKVQHAQMNIRDAFLALYRGLDLLKKFRRKKRKPWRRKPPAISTRTQASECHACPQSARGKYYMGKG